MAARPACADGQGIYNCLTMTGLLRAPLAAQLWLLVLLVLMACASAPDIRTAAAQLWLLVLLVLMARASAAARLALTAGLAGLTAAALPRRLWQPQLRRLGTLSAVLFALTAIAAGAAYWMDTVAHRG